MICVFWPDMGGDGARIPGSDEDPWCAAVSLVWMPISWGFKPFAAPPSTIYTYYLCDMIKHVFCVH